MGQGSIEKYHRGFPKSRILQGFKALNYGVESLYFDNTGLSGGMPVQSFSGGCVGEASSGMIKMPKPIEEDKILASPTKICGQSEFVILTETTNRTPPNIINPRPNARNFSLFFILIDFQFSFLFSVDQYQVSNVDDRSKALSHYENRVFFVYGIA